MTSYLKITQVFLLAMIKYFYAPMYGVALGMSFWANFIAAAIGGSIAFTVYFFFVGKVATFFHWLAEVTDWKRPKIRIKRRKPRNRIFIKRNRMIVKLRRNYGMWGIILLTPVLLSLPVGAFLLRKYYHHEKKALPIMIVSIVVEGFFLCILYYFTAHGKVF